MTTESKTQVAALVKEQIKKKGLSDNKASGMIDISNGTLSKILNNQWEGISDAMWLKCCQWVGYQVTSWKIYPSANLQRIFELCLDAQENHRLMAVSAPTGWGKTEGLQRYCRKTDEVYYVLATKVMSRKHFVRAIARALQVDAEGSVHDNLEAIIEALGTIAHPLLIIDDFGKLDDSSMGIIQIIYDRLQGHAGMVLAGMPEMANYIMKMAAKGKNGFAELKRRIGYWQPLKAIDRAFIIEAAEVFGITQEPALHYLFDNCKDYGSLRELLTNYGTLMQKLKAGNKADSKSQREHLASILFGASDQIKKYEKTLKQAA